MDLTSDEFWRMMGYSRSTDGLITRLRWRIYRWLAEC